jgi:hypothetical protein
MPAQHEVELILHSTPSLPLEDPTCDGVTMPVRPLLEPLHYGRRDASTAALLFQTKTAASLCRRLDFP